MRIQKVCLVIGIAVLLPSLALAQGAASGDLHVTVKDPQGQVVNNATVVVRDQGKGVQREASANGLGGYDLIALPPATYAVRVSAPGFATLTANDVVVTVGGSATLPVTLAIQGTKETVTVSSEAELIETTRTSTTDLVDQKRIDNLPINGRNYINFTLTDSQVLRDSAPNTGAAPTSGLNMSGQRARSNLVNVDGADATDNSINGVRSTVSQEAVQEFQIITNSYSPEYGRAAGGVVNIVTRSGGNDFHGDVFGYLRNRAFQAVNPFSTVKDPAYTRVQAGAAFGGAIKKDKTFYYFSYEVTRRHETGFSSIGAGNFGLVPFDTTQVGMPFGTLQLTPQQIGFFTDPQNLAAVQGCPNPSPGNPPPCPFTNEFFNYAVLTGASSGQSINGAWPSALVQGMTSGALSNWAGFPTSCLPGQQCVPVPASYQTLASQMGNFPVFEGTSLYSLRLDHTLTDHNRVMLRGNVSPSTITGIEVSGQDQPFGQNAYSRTSEQTYRDVAIVAQDTATLGNNKVNDFRFQYARRGLSYFYNTAIPGGSDPAVNIPGFAYFGREPYSYIQRTEIRYQFSDNLSWSIGSHNTKLGADFNYIPLKAVFTVNYGGVYDFGSLTAANLGFNTSVCPNPNDCFQDLSAVQAYGAGVPGDFIQGLGSPSDKFKNFPMGFFWQDSWRARHNLTLNYGVRYDLEIPPKFKAPTGLAAFGYNSLGLQKGIQTDKNNFQPRIGVAWDVRGDGKTVIRSSYGLFYDHPLLGLYFLGDASDGSTSGQLAFAGTGGCSFNKTNSALGNPANLNAVPIFQGLPINSSPSGPGGVCAVSGNPAVAAALGYQANQQVFQALNFPQSIFLNQNYLNPNTFLPVGFQPFGYPQAKNFVYAYSQQANFTVEHDFGHGYALSLAYNYNGGRHLNHPINANTVRGDLMVANFEAALFDAATVNNPAILPAPSSPFTVSQCNPAGGPLGPLPFIDASLMNFFRPSGINPSIAGGYLAGGGGACVGLAEQMVQGLKGFNTACTPANPSDPTNPFAGCVPFGDMDANYSNGSSVYHGLTANLRKRFSNHFEFLASYTWSHAIDDSTDLQSPLTPQDSYFPALDRSTSLFDQRHRFVFSGVYQSGHRGSGGLGFLLSDWTFAPLIEFSSGRPFNIITGNGDNLQLSSLTGRPSTTTNPACGQIAKSKFSPTGVLQAPCVAQFVIAGVAPTLLQLDGNLGRNAGLTPWTVFNDLRVSKRIPIGERVNMDFIVDMFNLANRYNVAAVSPLFTNAGQPTAAYDPRQFQFGMKLNW
jgi:hypothetical protein